MYEVTVEVMHITGDLLLRCAVAEAILGLHIPLPPLPRKDIKLLLLLLKQAFRWKTRWRVQIFLNS
jgi:hypothetical protein